MAEQLPVDQLSMVWANVEMQLGGFKEFGVVQKAEQVNYTVFVIRCHFALNDADLRIVIGSQGRIMGLFIQPPAGTTAS